VPAVGRLLHHHAPVVGAGNLHDQVLRQPDVGRPVLRRALRRPLPEHQPGRTGGDDGRRGAGLPDRHLEPERGHLLVERHGQAVGERPFPDLQFRQVADHDRPLPLRRQRIDPGAKGVPLDPFHQAGIYSPADHRLEHPLRLRLLHHHAVHHVAVHVEGIAAHRGAFRQREDQLPFQHPAVGIAIRHGEPRLGDIPHDRHVHRQLVQDHGLRLAILPHHQARRLRARRRRERQQDGEDARQPDHPRIARMSFVHDLTSPECCHQPGSDGCARHRNTAAAAGVIARSSRSRSPGRSQRPTTAHGWKPAFSAARS